MQCTSRILLDYSLSYMRAGPMSFSIFQIPRCRIHTFANICQKSLNSLNRPCGKRSSFRVLGSKADWLEGGFSRRWIRKPVSTKVGEKNERTQNGKLTAIKHELLDEMVSASATLDLNKTEIAGFQKLQYCDIQEKIPESPDLAMLVTVIVFDIETTGFGRETERIIEIALQDLQGGENSTFHTLVDPGRDVHNSHIHGITTRMVRRPDVPSMAELIPILLHYVKSRQKPGGYVVFVAHNARTFDVPFLVNEFNRSLFVIPPDWLFVDTLPMARETLKAEGLKPTSGTSLEALREKYSVPQIGEAHRAMSDVFTLSLILQRLTFELKLPLSGLIGRAFSASDLTSVKKKNSR